MKYFTLLISYFLIKLIIPPIERLYINSGFVKQNYKGDLIPSSMGIIFVFDILIVSLILLKIESKANYIQILTFMLGVLTMAFIGLIDDFIGKDDVKGFKGHIKMLINSRLTTGGLKAVFGGLVSVLISLIVSSNMVNFLINLIIISLFTNFINLLDLRPGRALKGFLILSIPALFFVSSIIELILLSFIGAALAYLPYDIKGKSMLGDIGSNSLGIILGIIGTTFPLNIKAIIAIFLILANFYSENYSISKLISSNKILSFIDDLGRG